MLAAGVPSPRPFSIPIAFAVTSVDPLPTALRQKLQQKLAQGARVCSQRWLLRARWTARTGIAVQLRRRRSRMGRVATNPQPSGRYRGQAPYDPMDGVTSSVAISPLLRSLPTSVPEPSDQIVLFGSAAATTGLSLAVAVGL
jgi:hypothetical protein